MTAYSTQTNNSAEQLIVICEANSNVGFGHFFRCLHLVDSLRKEYGINAYWVGNIAPSLVELLRQRNQQHIFLSHFTINFSIIQMEQKWIYISQKFLQDSFPATQMIFLIACM